MNNIRFVKSFSKGQITIPKEIRDFFGMEYGFWVKLYIDHGKIIIEPTEKKNDKKERESYMEKLLSIQGDWFDKKENMVIKEEFEAHFEKNSL